MGVVYRARDERLLRIVALKILRKDLLSDETARSRFRREAQALSHLKHRNIETLYEHGHVDGVDFLAMEYVGGETLARKISRGPLWEWEIVDIGMQIVQALEHAHEHGIIHRDLKPENVRVAPYGYVKILDFGLAKFLKPTLVEVETGDALVSRSDEVMGTMPYMPPEQLLGQKVDARSDVYALGAVLYEMATGLRAFPQEQIAQLIAAILTYEPKAPRRLNPFISPRLEAVIEKALERSPERRYQSATELREDLALLSVRRQAVKAQKWNAARLRSLVWSATGLCLLGLILGLIVDGLGHWMMATRIAGLESAQGRGQAVPPLKIDSLAVLPLANLSRDPALEYIADGMTDAVIAELARAGSRRVISRTSAMRYRKTDKSLPQIAKELDVVAVIEGSVVRMGDRVRITAQLIGVEPERHLWVRDFEGDIREMVNLQSEIARAIAKEVEKTATSYVRVR
jgi:eukaryotic-like serine/threonine-protein kinase